METARTTVAEVVAEIWRRATSVQSLPSAGSILLIGAVGLVLVLARPLWPLTRMLVTVTHEGGHAVAAVLTGRRLEGIRVHRDTSGLTLSRGRPRGPGMVITLVAGYLAPAVVGVGASLLLGAGRSLGLLWLLVALGVWMLLQMRNAYGFVVLLLGGTAMMAASWYLPGSAQSWLAYLVTWVLLLSTPKPLVELARQRRSGRAHGSDVDQLATLTGVPGAAWMTVLFVLACSGLVVGAAVLLPDAAAQVWAAGSDVVQRVSG